MTPKELSYTSDCLGVEQQLQTKCNDYAQKIQDQDLKNFVTQLSKQHQQHYTCLFNQLNAPGA